MRAKLETLSVSVLKEFAKDMKVKNFSTMRKKELIEAILEKAEKEEPDKLAAAGGTTEHRAADGDTSESRTYADAKTNADGRAYADAKTNADGRAHAEVKTNADGRAHAEVKTNADGRAHAEVKTNADGRAYAETRADAEDDRVPEEKIEREMASGILEIMQDGYGFMRCENYLPGENDIYVAPSQIRRFNLKTGDILSGPKKAKTSNEKFSALMHVESVNGRDPNEAIRRPAFESLTPIFPNERIHLERNSTSVAMRLVDLISPIGKGQRGMIVSQPKSGKTTLLKQIANAVTRNNPEMHIIILLIDERPEEVTDIKESIIGDNVEVIYSTFDELPERHRRVSEMVIERAKRLVEHGEDVIILLDSITRLARAYNLTVQASGRTLSGGLDPAALHMPKRFFGAARNMREGGSLTILATALVETGSKMDDVVFEEFKGTGNMELVLDRKLSEKRVFPAIDIAKSGTRREDLLLNREEREAVDIMRKALNGLRTDDAAERILEMFVKTRNNVELVRTVIRNRHI